MKERLHRDIVFRIDETHQVDSNVAESDTKEGHFDLQQEYVESTTPQFSIRSGIHGPDRINWSISGPVHFLHPLDLVTLKTKDQNGHDITMVVPAIMIKDIAHVREWKEISDAIRMGVNLFLIAFSLITLASGPGALLAILSIVDLGLATGDLVVQAFEDELRKTPEGRAFLDAWENVYTIVGGVTALAAIPFILTSGAKLLTKIGTTTTREQVQIMLRHSLQSLDKFPTFVDNTLIVLSNYSQYFKKAFTVSMTRLANEGVLLIQGIRTGETKLTYFLNYKGVMISEGKLFDVSNDIQNILSKGKGGLSKYLDELYLLKSGTGGGFRYIDEVTSLKMVGQEQPMSCAAACIRQIAKDNGVVISEEIARKAAKTDGLMKGTILDNIAPALNEVLNIQHAKGGSLYIEGVNDMKEAARRLSKSQKPWIAVLRPQGGIRHTIIVDKIIDDIVHIRDPWDTTKGFGAANGVEATLNLIDFEELWSKSFHYFCII